MKKKNPWLGFFLLLVRMTGFEPAQDCSHMDLNHTCLPFHHIREFNIKFMFLARLGQTLRVIPLAKWVALAYCKLPHLCKILRLAASCTARARLCIRFTTSARSSQRELAQRSALLTQGFAYLAFGCSSSSANFVSKFLMSTLARGFKRNTI